MALTFEQLIDRTYKALGQSSEAVNITVDDVVGPKINSIVSRLCGGLYIHPITQQKFTAGDLPFLRKKQFYNLVQRTSLNTSSTTSSVELECDTSNLLSVGAIYIDSEVIKYTSKTSTELLGITTPLTNHDQGAYIYQLYDMPSDIGSAFTVFVVNNKGGELEIPYVDGRYNDTPSKYAYTIVQDNEGNKFFHFMGLNTSSTKILVNYYIESTEMSQLSDECIIPNKWALSLVSNLAAGEIMLENEELEDAKGKLDAGCALLNEMYVFYNSQIKRSRQEFIPQQRDFRNITSGYGFRR